MLRYLSAGESHGPALTGIIEGLPAGLAVTEQQINADLARRQKGYGRGGRMAIEKDTARILSGVRWGRTLGSPVALMVENRDWENWAEKMSADPAHEGTLKPVTRPRPGHADLTGMLKYGHGDARNILERSSARETAMRVAVGAVAKALIAVFGVKVFGWVREIGAVSAGELKGAPEALFKKAMASQVSCPDKAASAAMMEAIDKAKKAGDSLGGVFEVVITGCPPGLGSYAQRDRTLDGLLACAMLSIQAMKGVEIGMGFDAARLPGSKVHDEIFYAKDKGYYRKTNHAGGIEGGMSNGSDIVIRVAMKPIPTLYKPLRSVDVITKEPFKASVERSDSCAVPAAAVVGEAVAAFVIAQAFAEKFGGDSVAEMKRNFDGYMEQVKGF
ncbi:MAG: chorismate synthase [Nitrospirae bacterium]|nr:chorismate synthase [Nitrospirota bacterium]